MDLYANEWQTFWRITFPLVFPGILAAALLCFSLSFDDFIVTNFNHGNTITFPMFVWGAAQRGIPQQVNVVGTVMFLIAHRDRGRRSSLTGAGRRRRWREQPARLGGRSLRRRRPAVVLAGRPGPARATCPRWTGPTRPTCVVVGGGYLGLWTALLAKERDPERDVLLLEAATCGHAASGRNGGFCEASLTHGFGNGLSRWPDELDAPDDDGSREPRRHRAHGRGVRHRLRLRQGRLAGRGDRAVPGRGAA